LGRAEDEYAGLCERVGRGMQLCGSHNMPYTDYAYVQLNWRKLKGDVAGVVVAWVVDLVGCADGMWRRAKRFLSDESTACYAGLCERVGRGMQLCGSHNMPYTDYAYVQLNWRKVEEGEALFIGRVDGV
jgi:hypothetical protein